MACGKPPRPRPKIIAMRFRFSKNGAVKRTHAPLKTRHMNRVTRYGTYLGIRQGPKKIPIVYVKGYKPNIKPS